MEIFSNLTVIVRMRFDRTSLTVNPWILCPGWYWVALSLAEVLIDFHNRCCPFNLEQKQTITTKFNSKGGIHHQACEKKKTHIKQRLNFF